MPKLNKKQIENELRSKIAKQYTAKIFYLEKENAHLHEENAEYHRRIREAEQEKLEMQDKLKQYEDWNRRLQEFMDMNEEDRIKYIENLRRTDEFDSLLKRFGFFSEMYGNLFV